MEGWILSGLVVYKMSKILKKKKIAQRPRLDLDAFFPHHNVLSPTEETIQFPKKIIRFKNMRSENFGIII